MLLLLGLLLMLLDRSCAAPATREVYRMPQSALKGKLPLLADPLLPMGCTQYAVVQAAGWLRLKGVRYGLAGA